MTCYRAFATDFAMTIDQAIAKLRALNEPVPTPPRLPTEQEIADAEQTLKAKFPPDYRKFLAEASDVTYGVLEPGTLTVPDAHNDLITIAVEAWEDMELPRKYLPICEDNGDYYCIQKNGKVVFWSHDDQELTGEEWPDLASWIDEVWIGEE